MTKTGRHSTVEGGLLLLVLVSTQGLELEDDADFHRRTWRAQRFGMFCLGLLALASLLGLFGNGPISSARVLTGAGAELEYQRFLTNSTMSDLQVTLPAGGDSVQLSRGFLDAIKMDRIMPEPVASLSTVEGVRYRFTKAPAPLRITFSYQADAIGRVRGAIELGSGSRAEIRQFYFP